MKKSFYLSSLLLAGTLLFSVAVKAAGPVFSLQPAPSSVCAGVDTRFVITASDTPSTITITYQWQVSTDSFAWTDLAGGGFYSGVTNDTLIIHTDTSINGRYFRCVATDSHGSSNSAGAVLTVYLLPDPGTISGASAGCMGSSFTLSETATGGTWSSVSPSIASIGSLGDVTANSQGFDTIKYTTTNAHCSAHTWFLVRVDTTVIGFPISGPPLTCIGATIAFTNPNVYGTWIWSSDDALIADVSTTGMVTGYSAGSTTITYAFSNTCNSVSSTKAVTVDAPLPAGTISGPSGVCSGSLITLSSSVTGGAWFSSSSAVAVVNTTGDVTGVSQGVVSISYYRSNGCGASIATHAVTVSIPAGSIVGSDSVGIGRTHLYTNPTVGGTWSVLDPSIATIGSTGVVTGVDTGITTITYSVSNYCGTSTATLAINVGPQPDVTAIAGKDSLCLGDTIHLSDAVTGTNIKWTIDTSAHASIDSVTGIVTGLTLGTSHVTYTYTNGFGPTTVYKDVVVHGPPVVSVTGPTNVFVGNNYQIRGVPFGGVWSTSNTTVAVLIATLDSAHLVSFGSVIVLAAGRDTITYTVTNTCGTRSSFFVLKNTLGVNTLTKDAGLMNIYPNPNNGEFTVNLASDNSEPASVVITNILGERVKELTIATNKNYDVRLDVPAGMYFLSASTENGKYSGRISVTK